MIVIISWLGWEQVVQVSLVVLCLQIFKTVTIFKVSFCHNVIVTLSHLLSWFLS